MIFVKTLSGRTLTLEANDVPSIKSRIEAIEGLNVEDQRLIYAGELFSSLCITISCRVFVCVFFLLNPERTSNGS